MIHQILQWANLNSGSWNQAGLYEMAQELKKAFSVLDCQQETLELPPYEWVNEQGKIEQKSTGPLLRFSKRIEASYTVLLTGHMDTVFDQTHPFQEAKKKDQTILTGPGVSDMKGGLCVMLHSLLAFEKTPFAHTLGWEVLINPDEEIGSLSSAPILEASAKHHKVGLIFEPSLDESGNLAGARRGSGKFTVVVKGVAAHVGRAFEQGRSAIAALATIMQSLMALNNQRAEVIVNVGFVHGGGPVNVVPDVAMCRLDVRYGTHEEEVWMQQQLERIVQQANEMNGITAEWHGKFSRKPKTIEGKTLQLYELVARLSENLGKPLQWRATGGCCDGNNLSAVGLPNVDTLGVRGGGIHSDQEYLLIDSLSERVQLTTEILSYLAQHPL